MNLYISYRRADAAAWAGRLSDALARRLSGASIVRDVQFLQAGVDFRAQMAQALAASDGVLVVIGPNWLGADGAANTRRIDDAEDAVRREIAHALRAGKRVLPVLVGGASLPPAGGLPADIAVLSQRQAVILRDDRWDDDIAALAIALQPERTGDAMPVPAAPAPQAQSPREPAPRMATAPRRSRVLLGLSAAMAVLAALVAVALLGTWERSPHDVVRSKPVPPPVGTIQSKTVPPPVGNTRVPMPRPAPVPPPVRDPEPRADPGGVVTKRPAPGPVSVPSPVLGTPWKTILLVSLLAAIVVWGWRYYRRRRPAAIPANAPAGRVAQQAGTPSVAPATRPVDVFVSHAEEDHELAEAIVSELERDRVSCWIAPRDIPTGVRSWAGPIVEAIARSRVFVVILSTSSNGSIEVLREVTLANEERVPFMPVRIDDTPLSADFRYFFATAQRMEAIGWPREKLLSSVHSGVGSLMKGQTA